MQNIPFLFNDILNSIYNLPLEERLEIKNLLEHNIAEARRAEILENCKKSNLEYSKRSIKFSSSIEELKKML